MPTFFFFAVADEFVYVYRGIGFIGVAGVHGPAFVHYYIFYAVVGCEVDEVFVGVKVATCFEVHVGAVGCGSVPPFPAG